MRTLRLGSLPLLLGVLGCEDASGETGAMPGSESAGTWTATAGTTALDPDESGSTGSTIDESGSTRSTTDESDGSGDTDETGEGDACAVDGQPFTITGSGFGTKSPAAPILFETFDGGTVGGYVADDSNWTAYAGTTGPMYSSDLPYGGGGLSAHNHVEYGDGFGEEFRTAHFSFPPTDELYYSYMSRHTGTSAGPGVYKNGRINTGSNSYSGDGMIAISDNYVFYRPDDTSVYPEGRSFSTVDIGSSNWQRHQLYGKVSSPSGTANGTIFAQVHTERKVYSDIVSRASGYSFQYETVILGLMFANLDPGVHHDMYVDDVYIDDTQARVEICSSSTWDGGSGCNPQPPTEWSDESITVTVNQGALPDGPAYLFVVDSSGTVSSGIPITLGGAPCGAG